MTVPRILSSTIKLIPVISPIVLSITRISTWSKFTYISSSALPGSSSAGRFTRVSEYDCSAIGIVLSPGVEIPPRDWTRVFAGAGIVPSWDAVTFDSYLKALRLFSVISGFGKAVKAVGSLFSSKFPTVPFKCSIFSAVRPSAPRLSVSCVPLSCPAVTVTTSDSG
ncbi:hypothetical protein ES703_114100 [subsurface metagenome]